jgi:predicted transcriptional regulator
MTTIETAVVLQQELLETAEAIAKAMNVSRDRVLEIALAEFVHQYQNRQSLSLDTINEAYTDAPDLDDTRLFKGMRRLHRQVLESDD